MKSVSSGSPSILIVGCDLLAAPGRVTTSVDIEIRENRIHSIRESGASESPGEDLRIDGSGLLAMPGLVNAHTHSPENCLRGVGEGLQLEPWLLNMFGSSGLFSPEDHYVNALAGAMEMLLLGVTSVVDHLWMTPPGLESVGAAVRAYDEIGIRAAVAPLMNDYDYTEDLAQAVGFDLGNAVMSEQVRFLETDELIAQFRQALDNWHESASGRVRILAGPGGVQWCSDELLGSLADLARDRGTGLHIHLLETDQQRAVCDQRFGRSSLAALADLGVLGPGCSLPHSVWIDETEIGLISESGSTVVHNPAANLRLGSGRCPVSSLLSAGATVAIGTDGSASSDNQNLWEMIKLAALIHNDGPRWVSGADALSMATTGGAAVMSMDGLGVLKEGAPADLILVDQALDGLAGAQELEPSLALSESGRSVRHVIVDGRLVVENGHCLTVDEPAVRAALRDQVVKRKQGVANPPESTRSAMSVMRSFNKSLRESATTLPTQVGGDRSAQK